MIRGEKLPATSVVAEVVGVLADYGHLPCRPVVEIEGGELTLTVTVPMRELTDLELHERLRRVQDVATVRAIAVRYGVAPAALEPFITGEG